MIGTYSELVAAVDDWLDLGGTQTTRIPTFVQLAEARMNRLLEDPSMEATASLFIDGNGSYLPVDFGSLVGLAYDQASGANATEYSIADGVLYFDGVPPSASAIITYRRRIPALSDANPTNWLLKLAPDAYLYGSLMQAEGFDANDGRVTGWKSLFDEAINELRIDGDRRKWGAGPMAPQIMRP